MTGRDAGQGALGGERRRDWMRRGEDPCGTERIEAYFAGRGYAMHRHDTYAVGFTLSGVQSFHYRGRLRGSFGDRSIVLHPDEPHDGQAGSDDGFRYRMLYVAPVEIQSILGGRPLPFVPGGISRDPGLHRAVRRMLPALGDPLEPFEREDALYELARALARLGGGPIEGSRAADLRAVHRAREMLASDIAQPLDMAALEAATGRARWGLARDFRTVFGTSPYRYRVLRRLDAAKALLRAGLRPAAAAQEAGFADQSHMTRHFRAAFGVTPRRWSRLQES